MPFLSLKNIHTIFNKKVKLSSKQQHYLVWQSFYVTFLQENICSNTNKTFMARITTTFAKRFQQAHIRCILHLYNSTRSVQCIRLRNQKWNVNN